MKQVRITGVPEHFNIFWKKLVYSQPYLDNGIELIWINEPKGSGAMNLALRQDQTEIAIVLTESFIKDKIEGNPSLITDWYVESPLSWGIHRSAQLNPISLQSISNPTMAISRFGSGSHLMSFLLAKRENWNIDSINFNVVNDLKGAINNAENKVDELFLWEKFTTKPFVEKGIFERIGEIPTPWPCFVTVANSRFLEENLELMKKIQEDIKYAVASADKHELISEIASEYNLSVSDVKEWIKKTYWSATNEITASELDKTMKILLDLNLIEQPIKAESLVSKDLCKLIQ